MSKRRRSRRTRKPKKPTLPKQTDAAVLALATNIEVQARCQLILEEVVSLKWTRTRELELAQQWGVDGRTVRGYRKRVIDALRDDLSDEDRESRRAEILAELQTVLVAAHDEGDRKAAIAGLRLKAQIGGVLQTTAPVVNVGVRIDRASPAELVETVLEIAPVVAGLLPSRVVEDEDDDDSSPLSHPIPQE